MKTHYTIPARNALIILNRMAGKYNEDVALSMLSLLLRGRIEFSHYAIIPDTDLNLSEVERVIDMMYNHDYTFENSIRATDKLRWGRRAVSCGAIQPVAKMSVS